MKSGLDFLLAAKRCEINELQQLDHTGDLVNLLAHLVHALQRERGLSNLFIASNGQGFATQRADQVQESQAIESDLRAHFLRIDRDAARHGHGARLFSCIAYVLQGLDALDALRMQVVQLRWDTKRTTEAYVRLVAGLLAVVFEAADSATNPEVSRLLSALFNFMQGKEFAGQERAAGAAVYGAGRVDAADQQRLLHLIESQERCIELFGDFAPPTALSLWQTCESSEVMADLERMRRMLCTAAPGAPIKLDLSQVWFNTCSQRMDGMKRVEDQLANELRERCRSEVARAQAELENFQTLGDQAGYTADPLSFFDAPIDGRPAPTGTGSQGFGLRLERSILDLVHEQSRRLQAMNDELETVRASLNERRLIERAKGLLMAHRKMNEAEAHKTLRQMAMNQNRRLVDVAEALLSLAEVLPAVPSSTA